MCAVVGEGVGLGGLFVLGPGPGGDVTGVAGGGAGLDGSIVPQGHGEDIRRVVAGPFDGSPRGEPPLDVEGVGGGEAKKRAPRFQNRNCGADIYQNNVLISFLNIAWLRKSAQANSDL